MSKLPVSDFDANEITLKFLANGVYQEVMEKKTKKNKPTKDDYKFYKKRVFSLHKQMLKGNYPTETLKQIHMTYVSELIDYMKITDRAEIIQKDFEKISVEDTDTPDKDGGKLTPIAESCTMEADKGIMKQVEGKAGSLDDFVERKVVKVSQPPAPPRRKNIDIKTEEHRNKGLKKKKKKKKKSTSTDA